MLKKHNWNVYKIFNNGKRAKLPTCQITAETDVEAKKIFLKEFLPSMSSKFQICNWVYVDEGDNQDRPYEQNCEFDAERKKLRDKFFVDIAMKLGGLPNNISITLVMSKTTDWKWQWAACQPATLKYLAGLSPKFDTGFEADAWLRDNINDRT